MRNVWIMVFSWLCYLVYVVYSYTQVEPNLVLSSRPFLWQIQQALWVLGYQNRVLSSLIYLLIIVGLMASYGWMIKLRNEKKFSLKQLKVTFGGSLIVMMLAYPALSHDVFNYLFNAKMVLKYQANPHIQVAMDFPQDPWLKYMHNIHTPAPYFYGWTAISLLPYWLGQEHLKVTISLFRLLTVAGLVLLIKGQERLLQNQQNKDKIWYLALNPLVLIETVGNIHNDSVMMALLIWGLVCWRKFRQKSAWSWLILSVLLIGLSISIKYITVLIIPGALAYYGLKKWGRKIDWGTIQALIHFSPLVILNRSQRFLPWYLLWSLSFVPMSQNSTLVQMLILTSGTALLSYIPFLATGEYTTSLLWLRTMIIFLPVISFGLTKFLGAKVRK